MKTLLTFTAIALMACGAQHAPSPEQGSAIAQTIDAATFAQHMEDEEATLVDVRTDGEVAEGKISGAIHIEYDSADMEAQFNALDKNKPVLVYCAAGGRSGRTKKLLVEWGFQEVYDLSGGLGAWMAAGMPVE